MPKIKYREIRLSPQNQQMLHTINDIIREYQQQDLVLTLRQLYYQLVSRDVIPNKQNEYAKVSKLLKEGRMAGVVDWNAIEDRLREAEKPAAFDSPEDIMEQCIRQYMRPRMEGQQTYLEVWVEKDALSGVLERVTHKYHIPIVVNRGYSSATAMHEAYKRFHNAINDGADRCIVLYLGDYDPSGIDMIRDVRDRVQEFIDGAYEYDNEQAFDFTIEAIALTKEQISKYKPPPNPAKMSDTRAAKFVAERGNKSWEVDALKPEVLNKILTDAILRHIDVEQYNSMCEAEQGDRDKLQELLDQL